MAEREYYEKLQSIFYDLSRMDKNAKRILVDFLTMTKEQTTQDFINGSESEGVRQFLSYLDCLIDNLENAEERYDGITQILNEANKPKFSWSNIFQHEEEESDPYESLRELKLGLSQAELSNAEGGT